MTMEINRKNYEEFFLLYVDNELSAGERKKVELFIIENPDLEEELVMLRQSTLRPDPSVVLKDKEWLLKQPEDGALINFHNCDEYFLLYADNELSDPERTAVEAFVALNPGSQKAFDYILHCRVEPDPEIRFEKKELLFRKESAEKRTLFFGFRLTAAACFFLLAGYGIFSFFSNHGDAGKLAGRHTGYPAVSQKKKNTAAPVTPDKPGALQSVSAGAEQIAAAPKPVIPARSSLKKKDGRMLKPADQLPESSFVADKKSIPDQSLQDATPGIDPADIHVPEQGMTLSAIGISPATAHPSQNINNIAQHNSPGPVPADQADGVSVLTATAGKGKLRGFFRKVTRVFERTTRVGNEDDKNSLLIGNFQIALK